MHAATVIILARSGSKGVPGKNLATLAGKPCAQWTIEHALGSRAASRVALTTDSPELLALARAFGCEPIERPPDLATDGARIDDAARHAHAALGHPAGPVVLLYANVPVRPPALTDDAVDLLVRTGAHSVQSYAPVGKHHPWWTARLEDSGRVMAWEGEVLNHGVFRRQDLPPAFVPDGGVLALTPDALHLRLHAPAGPHAFFGTDRRGVLTPEGAVVDIDSPVDLLVADAILSERTAHAHR